MAALLECSASYRGLFGIRPSHNVIEKDGLIPLAPLLIPLAGLPKVQNY
ncbi:hypothetical protein ACOBV8_21390 (plasmid) [Pseudoalteromonas espejiana]